MYKLFTAFMRRLFYFFTARELVVKAHTFCTAALPLANGFAGEGFCHFHWGKPRIEIREKLRTTENFFISYQSIGRQTASQS